MKTLKILSAVLFIAGLFSCSNSDDLKTTAPELPPYESIDIDFSKFQVQQKSAYLINETGSNTLSNWGYSSSIVGVWSTVLKGTMAIPTAAFYHAFNTDPVISGENLWQWAYEVPGFTSTYKARLTAQLEDDMIIWKMYIAKEGIDSFEEFLWFDGISYPEMDEGVWTLYHSPGYPEKVLCMEWRKSSGRISKLKYTYVREKNNNGEDDSFYSSYLEYGEQATSYDIYYNIHSYNIKTASFQDIFINWDSQVYKGQVKSESYFKDEDWHCWDEEGRNTDCE